jgi:hypothetical protein
MGIGMAIDWAYDKYVDPHVQAFLDDTFGCETANTLRKLKRAIDFARSLKNPIKALKNLRANAGSLKGLRGVAAKTTGKKYVTYTKPGPNGETYSGRTSGPSTMTPEEIVARRDAGHHMNDKDFGPAVLDRSSSNGAAIRGREQQLIEANGGARSTGGTSGNAINGISPTNKKGSYYRSEADREFGGGL